MSNSNFHFKWAISNVFHETKLVDLDSDVTVSRVLSDAYIINDVTVYVKIEDDEADDEDIPEEDIRSNNPSYEEVVKAISIVESYSVFTTFGDDLRKGCTAVTSTQ